MTDEDAIARGVADAYQMAGYYAHVAAERQLDAANESLRPFILYRARVFQDGDQWCALLGSVETGVCGYGETPDAAARAFDEAWQNQQALKRPEKN